MGMTIGDYGGPGSDADRDGDSDGVDFLAWQRQFSAVLNPITASTMVPEPSTAAWSIGFILAVLSARQRRAVA